MYRKITHPLRYPHKALKIANLVSWKIQKQKNDAPSPIRHFNIPNDQLNSMEKRFGNYLNMPRQGLTMYDDEKTINYISSLIHQVHKVDPMLFWVDTVSPHSCMRYRAPDRIVLHFQCRCIPTIYSNREFKFCDILVRSRGIVEIMLPTPGSKLDIPVRLEVVDAQILELLGQYVLDGNNLLVENVINHLRSRKITKKYPLKYEDMWKIKLITKGNKLYVLLFTPIQL